MWFRSAHMESRREAMPRLFPCAAPNRQRPGPKTFPPARLPRYCEILPAPELRSAARVPRAYP